MDPKPAPQPLLSRRPVCGHCLHGHMVEVVAGRANSPVEYHCGYCGNYAIVGVPARWPFMEVVKADPSVNPANNISRKDFGENISKNCSSPIQVGETLRPEKESVSILPKCKAEGCSKLGGIRGFCAKHFNMEFGISYDTYLRNRKDNNEDPKAVAARWTDRRRKEEK